SEMLLHILRVQLLEEIWIKDGIQQEVLLHMLCVIMMDVCLEGIGQEMLHKVLHL
ncbi:hypothetical protein BGX29_001750, partial [Mortierella sp. GBA35]